MKLETGSSRGPRRQKRMPLREDEVMHRMVVMVIVNDL